MMNEWWSRLRKAAKLARRTDVFLLAPFERAMLARAAPSNEPQCFILGLPRSGTTLVYQYLVHRLQVAYFTNTAGRYYLSPCLATKLQLHRRKSYSSDFESSYGEVDGPMAPHEAGTFWARFFGFDGYVSYRDVSRGDVQTMRRTIGCMQQLFGGVPFVNKNVKHMLRLDALAHIFPQSLFVVVERRIEDVALSLLRARYDNLEDPQNWWSVKPPGYEALRARPAAEQVAHQLHGLSNRMAADLAELSDQRHLTVRYETFCEHPEDTIRRIREKLGPMPYRSESVDHFEASTNRAETEEEAHLLDVLSSLR